MPQIHGIEIVPKELRRDNARRCSEILLELTIKYRKQYQKKHRDTDGSDKWR